MPEELSERDSLSTDLEMYIENHNNVLFQGGYSIPMGASSKTVFKVQPGFVIFLLKRTSVFKRMYFVGTLRLVDILHVYGTKY